MTQSHTQRLLSDDTVVVKASRLHVYCDRTPTDGKKKSNLQMFLLKISNVYGVYVY